MKINKIAKDFIVTTSICIVAIITLQGLAFAADSQSGENVFDIVSKFASSTKDWDAIFQKYAIRIFMSFMSLDICILGIKSALEGSAKHDTLRQFVMLLIFGGFIVAVINNHHDWSWKIINGFTDIAKHVAPSSMNSAAPFELGLVLAGKVLDKISGWSPIDSLGYMFTGLIIIICFALLSAQVIYIKCSSIISLGASMILLGFGGSSFTKEYALNAIRFVLAIAFRLFVINLLLGVGASIINSFGVSDNPSYEELFVIIGASVVLLTLVSRLPDEAASILNGSNISSGMALIQTAGAVGSMVAGVGAMGAGLAGAPVNAAKSMSSANQLANMDGKSGLGKAGSMAKNLWNSRQQANADMPGQSTLKRMNSNMKAQIDARKHKQNVGGQGSNSNGDA